MENLKAEDLEIYNLIEEEKNRQKNNIELIASENFVSKAVLEATGSILTNKYAEGYPSRRYYGGCQVIDKIEQLAIDRLKDLYQMDYANVQPHSGSNANMAVYYAFLEPGDKVLGMNLSEGGHLTHGSPVNISGSYFDFYHYGVDGESELIDYQKVLALAKDIKPKIIVAGASAYTREIDFSKFRQIADEVGALLMVDMAHIAGLVAAGLHMSPSPYADIITSTSHKTLRGPRGAFILAKKEYGKKIDKAVFPGFQGGPLEHVIAAKAVAFKEASSLEFKNYQEQVVKNARALGESLKEEGIRLVSDGTDNHMVIMDVGSIGLTGKKAEELLDQVNITTNKNTIPNEKMGAFITSGVRLGSAAMTSRGMKEEEFKKIGQLIGARLKNDKELEDIKREVKLLVDSFPLNY